MCLIIFATTGGLSDVASRRKVADFVSHNPDGFGYCYHDDDGAVVQDRSVNWSNRKIRAIMRGLPKDRPVAVHFRMATSGYVVKSQAHPFPIAGGAALMHNGVVMSASYGFEDLRSDTEVIANHVSDLVTAHPDLLYSAALRGMLDVIFDTDRVLLALPGKEWRWIGSGNWSNWRGLQFSNEYAWDLPRELRPVATTPLGKARATYPYDGTYNDGSPVNPLDDYYVEPVKREGLKRPSLAPLAGTTIHSDLTPYGRRGFRAVDTS